MERQDVLLFEFLLLDNLTLTGQGDTSHFYRGTTFFNFNPVPTFSTGLAFRRKLTPYEETIGACIHGFRQ